MIEAVAAVKLGDVGVEQPQLAAHLAGMRLADRGPALAQRLDLGAAEHEAGLDAVLDRVVVEGAPVLRDDLALTG